MTPTEGILGLLAAAVAGNPASVFLEKISAAIEGGLKPWQLRRVASAETDAAVIKAEGDGKITEIKQRAALRVAAEDVRNQRNIEALIIKALPNIREDAKSEGMDDDWLANFFDKCRLISNEEMQNLWAQVLAGEANSPGAFSLRTINFLSTMSQEEAQDFKLLCSYNWKNKDTQIIALIFDTEDKNLPIKLSFNQFQQLKEIGLIEFKVGTFSGGYSLGLEKYVFLYHNNSFEVSCKMNSGTEEDKSAISVGKVILTQIGLELASICQPNYDERVVEYVMKNWQNEYNVLPIDS